MRTVTSKDGTRIACFSGGSGPNLVLVHGTSANHTRWTTIRPRLEERFTVTEMDRRGRGDSGDAPDYAIEREFEDVVAVVNSLEPPILIFGHSYGALCALEAAMRTDRLAGLVLYEPPIIFDDTSLYAAGQIDRLDALLEAGDRAAVVTAFMDEIVGLTPRELEMVKASPAWPGRVAAAHTIARECRAEEIYRLDASRAGKISIPVLLLLGGDSPAFFGAANALLEEMLSDTRTVVMPGQQHMAMDTAPDLVVEALVGFWREIEPARAGVGGS
jgi:pimeloyl-ACP methyl ester carboxylesterase